MSNNIKKGILIVFSGPSGVGKGTVRRALFKRKKLNLAYSISLTTRLPREKEIEGVDYYFVTKEQFFKNIEEGKLLEWAEFVGNYYGTPSSKVDELLALGKNVMLEIEVEGAKQVLARRPDCLSIFLLPPNLEVLEKRIRGRRSEPEEIIQQRLKKSEREINEKDKYQYCVINDTIGKTVAQIAKIIEDEIEK